MQERLLHFIWRFQYFNKKDLTASQGQSVNVLHPGFPNMDAGPDFLNARIEIDGILWVGDVEIHIKSSGWTHHRHHEDARYDSVALHVSWEHDAEARRNDGSVIPGIELKHKVVPGLLHRYNDLVNSPLKTPCAGRLNDVDRVVVLSMTERALAERLENKTDWIRKNLEEKKGDWEEIAYRALARNMGFKTNAGAFLQLAAAVPYRIIARHLHRGHQVEALLFGQAGFLDHSAGDPYFMELKKEYEFLAAKYQLQRAKMSRFQWKFMRMRPANFPTIRIAQFAALLIRNRNLFALFRDHCQDALRRALTAVQSMYWQEHYDFGKKAKRPNRGVTVDGATNIMINTAAPLLTAFGKASGEQRFVDKALGILAALPPENNHVVRMWKDMGIEAKNAFDSQGLLELYNNYCCKKKCIDCSIGVRLLQN